jgi:hypothetical protein
LGAAAEALRISAATGSGMPVVADNAVPGSGCRPVNMRSSIKPSA